MCMSAELFLQTFENVEFSVAFHENVAVLLVFNLLCFFSFWGVGDGWYYVQIIYVKHCPVDLVWYVLIEGMKICCGTENPMHLMAFCILKFTWSLLYLLTLSL